VFVPLFFQTPKEVNSLPSVVTWSQPPHLPGGSNTHIINMEWGNFGAGSSMASLPLSAYDVVVDRKSPNPGKVSGKTQLDAAWDCNRSSHTCGR